MKRLIIFLLVIAALQACGSYNSESRGTDRGSSYNTGDIPPSYAHPAGGTMGIEP